MFGHVVICTQNLSVSGANQVLLNLVEGQFCKLGEIVVISPVDGPFAQFFLQAGCAVRIGGAEVLTSFTTIRLAVCNTVMTAHLILELHQRGIPNMWILHEWWPREMLADELRKRNLDYLTQATVDEALTVCGRVICVCKAQKEVYSIKAPCDAIYVGVPVPSITAVEYRSQGKRTDNKVRFLTLGIVCPRKNQQMAVRAFKQFAGDRDDVELDIVGARYIRDYEKDYVKKVEEEIDGDPRIKLHPVTDDPAQWYARADVLLFLSVNEVTPLVIAEAGLHGLPSIVYDIGGIKEMALETTGFLLKEGDLDGAVEACRKLADDRDLLTQMGNACIEHFQQFTIPHMVRSYEVVANELSPTTVLLDMDGVLVDWDAGFRREWAKFGHDPSKIDRTKSYCMEDCVAPELRNAAITVMSQPGFFRDLPPMIGAIKAVEEMIERGFSVLICTSPLPGNPTCPQDKTEWVQRHLGHIAFRQPGDAKKRLNAQDIIVMTRDKTFVMGDVLIDDKPVIRGCMRPTWEHIVFGAPYNELKPGEERLRFDDWSSWQGVLAKRLSPFSPIRDLLMSSALPSNASMSSLTTTTDDMSLRTTATTASATTASDVRKLRDFSAEIPYLKQIREDYLRWRSGDSRGLKVNIDSAARLQEMIKELEDAAAENEVHQSDDDTQDVFALRKQTRDMYRKQYAKWRTGKSEGARSNALGFSPDSRRDRALF
jgi:5'-nucleotidase